MKRSTTKPALIAVNARIARAASGLALSALMLTLTPAASAQYANGNGQSLQANFHRFNQSLPSRDALASTRVQNSVIYGNAPGGKSFQGNLGYRNPSEFQGRLGSNDLYNFTRDSAFSGLAGQGIRGSELNDYQGALSRGERGLSASLGGIFDVQRQGTNYNKSNAITPTARTGKRDQPGAASIGNLRLNGGPSSYDPGGDVGDSFKSTLRSSLTASLASNLGQQRGLSNNSRSQGYARPGTSTFGADNLLADSVSNLRSTSLDRPQTATEKSLGLSGATSDAMRDRNRAAPAPRPGQAPSSKVGGANGAGLGPNLAVPTFKTSHDDLQDRLNKLDTAASGINSTIPKDQLPDLIPGVGQPANPSTNPLDNPARPKLNPDGTPAATDRSASMTWQSRMEDLRNQLSGDSARSGKVSLLGSAARSRAHVDRRAANKPGDTPSNPTASATKSTAKPLIQPDSLAPLSGIARDNTAAVPEKSAEDKPNPDQPASLRPKIDPKTLQLIRDAGSKVETLKPTGSTGKDVFTEHMQAGEKLLGDSMFFDAEDRFAKAVSSRPNDVTGHIGRVHAQMGSGLFRSAGFSLRKVLAAYPEATGQRYAPALLPTRQRLDQLLVRLRENLNVDGAAEPAVRRDSALLLAYIGFQTTDRKTTEEGIAAMAKAVGQDPNAKPGDDEKLIELLRGVWLDDSFYKSPAEPAPIEK